MAKELFKKFSTALASETLAKFDDEPEELAPLRTIEKSVVPTQPTKKKKTTNYKEHPVINLLAIPYPMSTDNLINSQYVDKELQFTRAMPVGFDMDQVAQFCDRLVRDLKSYQNIVNEQQRSIEKLIDELDRVEDKVADLKSDLEVAAYMHDNHDDIERLKTRIQKLESENKELKDLLKKQEQKSITKSRPSVALPEVDDLDNM